MQPSRVAVLIEYRSQPDHVARAVSELEALVAKVVASEPDCFGIRLLQDPADPARVLLVEEWSSREAYLGPHFQTPHLKAFIETAPALFSGPPDIRFWAEHSRHARTL
jgi:quinol monooxygenase YgiN